MSKNKICLVYEKLFVQDIIFISWKYFDTAILNIIIEIMDIIWTKFE